MNARFEAAVYAYISFANDFEQFCGIKRNGVGEIDFGNSSSLPRSEDMFCELRDIAQRMDNDYCLHHSTGSWLSKLESEISGKASGKKLTDLEIALWLLKAKNGIQAQRVSLGIDGNGAARKQFLKPQNYNDKQGTFSF